MVYPGATNPSLIVMPRSLLFNWEKELDRFAPQISHATYYGTDCNLDEALKADVVLTTYAVMRNDAMKLKDHMFQCIVLDESQNIGRYAVGLDKEYEVQDSQSPSRQIDYDDASEIVTLLDDNCPFLLFISRIACR